MPRRKNRHTRRLNAAQVRGIFKSLAPAGKVAKEFGVSENLVYLIWRRRIHKAITQHIRKPIRKRRKSGSVSGAGPRGQIRIDIDKLADAILKRFFARLRKA